MSDIYTDSERRYRNDAEFKTLVDMLYNAALTHGFTPGELKQAAFLAALKAEQHAAKNGL